MPMNESAVASGSAGSDYYRVAALDIFPAGEQSLLVSVKSSQEAGFIRGEIVDLLMQCQEWKTLDEHIQTYSQLRPLSPAVMRTMRRELQRLAQRGYLVGQKNIRAALHGFEAPAQSCQIASLVFPTSERVELLQRSLVSSIENSRRFERSNDFIVADDSPTPATRDAYRQMLRALKAHYGVALSYAGREEKVAYARALSTRGQIPEDIVCFACLGDPQYGLSTVGANRNTLLLHTVGDIIFSADDDTLCNVAAAPDADEQLAWASGANPLEAWFFPTRESALQALHFTEQDPLAAHEQWLGKQLQTAIAAYGSDATIALDQAEPVLLQRVMTQPGQVVLTLNGMVGDCCWDNPHFYLFQSGETYRRLAHSEQAYQSARMSREMIQAVKRTTIVHRMNAMFALYMGLDNRALLPPFTPVGRAEEIGFILLLAKCFDTAYAAYLNQVMQHFPTQARSFRERPLFSLDISSWLPFCIGQCEPGFARDPAERLRKIGQQLQDIGRLPQRAFEEFARLFIWKSASGFISTLEERLHASTEVCPPFWRQDAQELILQARQQALLSPEQWYTSGSGPEQLQCALVRVGQMLEWWPAMIETAHQLRAEGLRLARPI